MTKTTDAPQEEGSGLSEEEQLPAHPTSRKRSPWVRYGVIAVAGVLVAVSAASGYHFGVRPSMLQQQAQEQLQEAQAARGTLTPRNTTLQDFSAEELIDGTNPKQKALGASSPEEAAVFTFWNGKETEARVVDIYVDFSAQRSRDFILQNQLSLKGAVESGSIVLRVHPVPNSASPFSLYAPEALAEAFVVQPTFAWNYLVGLLKLSAELSSAPQTDTAQAIADRAQALGLRGIDKASITNGTFASWVLAVGQQAQVQSPHGLPAVYFDGALLDSSTVDINDPTVFRSYLTK